MRYVHMWRTQDNFVELLFYLYLYVGSKDELRFSDFLSKRLHPLRHLTEHIFNFVLKNIY